VHQSSSTKSRGRPPSRRLALGGGHDEREQTLNQCWSRYGFDPTTALILVAATNRPDVLDPAAARPGRFDRRVVVGRPDVRGREEVLRVHARQKFPLPDDCHLRVLARGTPGSRAPIWPTWSMRRALNPARLTASRSDDRFRGRPRTKSSWAPSAKSMCSPTKKSASRAYHEAGHALVAALRLHADPPTRVTSFRAAWRWA